MRKSKKQTKFSRIIPWAGVWPWSKRCKARLKRGQDPTYHGRCDLQPHDTWDHAHLLERGMDWVRWNDRGEVWYEPPQYRGR